MRLMIVGSDEIYAIENIYVKYLRAMGIDVELFVSQKYFYEYYNKSIFNKLLYKSSLSGIITQINKKFRAAVEEYNPDIIWIFKGMEILPESLEWSRGRNIKLVNYNPDNPFIFSGKGSGNKNITNSIGLYDLHFTYNLEVKEKLEKDYKQQVVFLPFGFDVNDAQFRISSDQEENIKVCFAGNPDTDRAKFIDAISLSGIQIDLFGNYWNRFVNRSNINVFGPVYGDEFLKVLRRYRVQLNLMRIHNENSHNMRSFEVPGIGGIMLAPDTREHRMFFEKDRNVFLFGDIHDMTQQIHNILDLNKEEAEKVRKFAREDSIKSGFEYKSRAKQVSESLNFLLND
jgi:spore maturation protein CgeB